ncbi:CG2-related protein, putative [Plasmodium gallinaceum]|uniref:CG2-related protein, putative n=1 Tax=Plasmodium gallinaceum TaxID=5849 RepID=A0A1J1H0B2_PLAGA|nr:CG2-related protein, putative [Plasmodium gallinaceum]CRG96962.1 CG2-related protein, putative [Plasmodium gallinaceum]
MTNENSLSLVNFSNDVFLNIIKYLTLNETLKLKIVSKNFYEYLKGEKAYYLNTSIYLNNYIKFVKFIKSNKFCNFFLSILKDEKNIYNNPHYVKKYLNFGINKKQLVENKKGFLKKITLKGEFLRNSNIYDISLLLFAHSNSLEELYIHGLNDINCPLFIYSSYSIIFDFFAKEILLNNLSLNYITKNDLKEIQNLILQKEERTQKNVSENDPFSYIDNEEDTSTEDVDIRKNLFMNDEIEKENEKENFEIKKGKDKGNKKNENEEEKKEGEEEKKKKKKNDNDNGNEENIKIYKTNKMKPFFPIKNGNFKIYKKKKKEYVDIISKINEKNIINDDNNDDNNNNNSDGSVKLSNYELNINDYLKKKEKKKMLNLINKDKLHILCEHLSIVYNCNKKCLEKIRNYKQKLHLNNYINSLQFLKILNFSGIQTYDFIEMFIPINTPSLKILNIYCYDYFFYFYHMLLSIFLYGIGTDIFTRYINQKKNKNNMDIHTREFIINNKKVYEAIKEIDMNLIENNYMSCNFQKKYEQEAINYYQSNIRNNEKKIFFTPTYKDKIYLNNFSNPVYYADGSYIKNDSDTEFIYNTTTNNDNNCTKRCIKRQLIENDKKKIKKLKRGGYIWLIENYKYKKNVSIEILYLFKNIIENEEKKGRRNIICLLNNLSLEHFSLFNYSLSSPFLWLLLLIKNQNLKTFCILDLCLSHLLSALTFLEAFLKQNLFNFQGMMRRRRKRIGSIYFKFNDEEEIKFVNQMYSKIINELNRSNFTPKKNKVLHIVIYVYNNKKGNKQFIKYIRKISRSLWRCNYLVFYSIQYYKYKYFNKYFDIDNLYRDYVINILLSNHKLNRSLNNQKLLSDQ